LSNGSLLPAINGFTDKSSLPLVIEPQNHQGWKRPLRSSSPTITPTPPCLLNHVPECQIYTCAGSFCSFRGMEAKLVAATGTGQISLQTQRLSNIIHNIRTPNLNLLPEELLMYWRTFQVRHFHNRIWSIL